MGIGVRTFAFKPAELVGQHLRANAVAWRDDKKAFGSEGEISSTSGWRKIWTKCRIIVIESAGT